MSSAPASSAAASSSTDAARSSDDRTARARIRDVAMRLFGEDGFTATTVRRIADEADVSPALVVHHFGSKQGLRDEVEAHLLGLVREGKLAAMTGMLTPSGSEYDAMARQWLPAMGFLARSLAEGSEVGVRLYERLYADALEYMAAGVEAGVLRPTDDERARTAVLLNHGLSTLLLRHHAEHVLDVAGDVDFATHVAPVVLDLYTDGLFVDDRFRTAFLAEGDHDARATDPDPPPSRPAP